MAEHLAQALLASFPVLVQTIAVGTFNEVKVGTMDVQSIAARLMSLKQSTVDQKVQVWRCQATMTAARDTGDGTVVLKLWIVFYTLSLDQYR